MDSQLVQDTPGVPTLPARAVIALREAADTVEANCVAGDFKSRRPFGGCYVMVSPGEDGKVISVVMLDSTEDAAQFWATIKAKADIAGRELGDRERQGLAFGHR